MDKYELLSATVFIEDPGGVSVVSCDCLESEGTFWLVPEWLPEPDGQTRRPARIIRLDPSATQQASFAGMNLLVSRPVPRAVLSGQSRSAEGVVLEVREAPAILLAMPMRH